MRRTLLVLAIATAATAATAALTPPAGAQSATTPRAGLVISRSARLTPGVYRIPAQPSMDSALIVVRGDDMTLDLAGVTLVGAPENGDPDAAAGVAILVDGGANVTIKNATIRGYKVAVLARGTRNLRLFDNDLSFNWKSRLYSIVEHESLVDWLSYHHNEKDEWLRHGAAIYLSGVRGGELRGNTVQQGMNGLMMTQTDSLLVWNNDFSFNSGVGIGLYRSDKNRIMHNRVDYDVRGYSEGFYRRGQDSAGLLIYEQSDSNIVSQNSVTHGGDGLFLWAGQHTMDTGQGGANDNIFHRNNFSWAPTNGIEATFSRNVFLGNTVIGNDHGMWGGYSYNSLIASNRFERNRIGIAIEHGQENEIVNNRFDGDSTTISLWANTIEPSDWGYPKHRDTQSRDYLIADNFMQPKRVALRIKDTRRARVERNTIWSDSVLVVGGDTSGFVMLPLSDGKDSSRAPGYDFSKYIQQPLPGGINAFATGYTDWPRSTIIVDEWGPYDWKHPKLWPADSSLSTPLKLRVLGPPGVGGGGAWRLVSARGARVSKSAGRVGDTIVVTPLTGPVEDWRVTLEYRGAATRSPRGIVRGPNAPYLFSYSRFDPKPEWEVKVFAWSDSTHPMNSGQAFLSLLRGERGAPVLSLTTPRLDYMWYRPSVSGWPQERAGVSAAATVDLPAGSYTLRTISDDGIRVFIDDAQVIDDWGVHESRVREAPIAAGRHRIRIEYFQGDGWTELRAEIVKAAP